MTYEHSTGNVENLVSYNDYVELCNQGAGSRKEGVLSEAAYREICVDPETVFIGNMPILSTMSHGLGCGYDVARTTHIAEHEHAESAYLLLVPFQELSIDQKAETVAAINNILTRKERIAVFYSENLTHDESTETVRAFIEEKGIVEKPIFLGDPRIENPGLREAALSLFTCDIQRVKDQEEADHYSLRDVWKYSDEHPEFNVESIALVMGDSLTLEQQDDFWDLYADRFSYLGENHPISMEDSKDDFLRMLTTPHTMISAKYVDEKPVCFTLFMDGFDDIYWLNKRYLDDIQSQAKDNQSSLFFQGIVASGEGGGYAGQVIDWFATCAAKIGMSAIVYFENTNLSEQYIPRIVKDTLAKQPEFTVYDPEKVDECWYRALLLSRVE